MLGVVCKQLHRALPVPETERLRLVLALDVVGELHLDDDLRAVGQPCLRDELRVRRLERIADLELPRRGDRQ